MENHFDIDWTDPLYLSLDISPQNNRSMFGSFDFYQVSLY